ncbi:ATP synthase F1 subunit epsilon [Roseivirga misakiensis]|uniref:ATP synthase F1 subunit epsilon n=1 Tax=Roseivirga misakiensis TaxID=1563681 RepID=A0A1E5T5H8_9BACT|nr:ATP synthase F1 subunit epsilon [Roseivirga misakiensis]OEK06598.1 ATP synthase F1 subunit epsilon [Roseivirga misakiensis]
MLLEVVTPDKKVFEGEASSVIFPGSDGEFQVLDNHAPMISALGKGKMTISASGKQDVVVIDGGVVEVLNNNVIVLAESVIED